jgi:hypothetical protein
MRDHAVQRLAERHGIRRNPEGIIAAARARILAGEAKFIGPAKAGRSLWSVYVAGRRIRVIWEEAALTIVTVLPARRRGRASDAEAA